MANETKTKSNRANPQKSPNPTRAAGRENHSLNRLRAQDLARVVVVDGESHELFETLFISLLDEFQPANQVESHLVATMAVARWRQQRMWGVEQVLAQEKKARLSVRRLENSFDLQFQRAYNLLIKVKQHRHEDQSFISCNVFLDE